MSTQSEAMGRPSSEQIALRLRGYMGEKKISRVKLALATGINRTSIGKKLDNEVSFAIDEISAVCDALGLTWQWVTTGTGEREIPHPDGPDGGSVVRPKGFEPLTS